MKKKLLSNGKLMKFQVFIDDQTDTAYWCSLHKFKDTDRKHHFIGVSIIHFPRVEAH